VKVRGELEIIYFVPSSFFAFHFYSIFKQESVANSQKRKNPQHLRVAGLQAYIVAILSILTHAELYEPPSILIRQALPHAFFLTQFQILQWQLPGWMPEHKLVNVSGGRQRQNWALAKGLQRAPSAQRCFIPDTGCIRV